MLVRHSRRYRAAITRSATRFYQFFCRRRDHRTLHGCHVSEKIWSVHSQKYRPDWYQDSLLFMWTSWLFSCWYDPGHSILAQGRVTRTGRYRKIYIWTVRKTLIRKFTLDLKDISGRPSMILSTRVVTFSATNRLPPLSQSGDL